MHFSYKLLSAFLVLASILTSFNFSPISVKAQNSLDSALNTSNQGLGKSSSIAQQAINLGWGPSSNSEIKSNSDKATLSATSLQNTSTSYVCNANYFASYNSTIFSSYRTSISSSDLYTDSTTDGQGNIYTWSYNYIGWEGRVSRINSAGVETKISLNPNYVLGNMVANNNGDAFGLILEGTVFKIMKISAGQNTTTIIHTFSTDKIVTKYALRIDNSGNLYLAYTLGITTKIDKISPSGTLLNTFTLPTVNTYGNSHRYSPDEYEVSSGGLIYFPTIKMPYATAGNYYIVVLNSDGTKKGDFMYSTAGALTNFAGLTKVPNGVTGGGVYLSYVNVATTYAHEGSLFIKKILDTDSLISAASTFSPAGIYSASAYKSLVSGDNQYYYFYEYTNRKLFRINISNSVMETVLPLNASTGVNNFGISLVQNQAGDIIVSPGNSNDLFKVNCSGVYTPTTITVNNLNLESYSCNQGSNTNAEMNYHSCVFYLIKGLTYQTPTSVQLQMVGSGAAPISCDRNVGIGYIICSGITSGNFTNSANRELQINIDGAGFTTIATITTWQNYGAWSPNSITLAGPTEEIIYNNKMYQAGFGTDAGLYLRSMDTSNTFSNWQRLSSITVKGTPSLSLDPNGDLYVFAHGTDNGLYYWKVGEAGGERWRRVGSITISDAVTVHSFNGKYWLYATGTDNGLYVSKYTSFSATSYASPNWTKAGDITVNQTVHGALANSNLYQIAVGTDDGLYYRLMGTNEIWGNWIRKDTVSYAAISKPVVKNNKIAISAVNKFINFNSVNVDFLNEYFKNSNPSTKPSNLSLHNGEISEAIFSTDSKLRYKNSNKYGFNVSIIEGNGITIKDIPSQFSFNSKQYQFVRGTDNKLWTRSRN